METKVFDHFPKPVYKTVLSNGLTIISVDTGSKFANIQIGVRAGSFYESRNNGVAHLLEHLIYEGPARDGVHPKLKKYYDKGSSGGAQTGRFATMYDFDTYASEGIRATLDLLSLVLDFEVDQQIMDLEKKVVQQEIEQKKPDPGRRLEEWRNSKLFTQYPSLHRCNMGTEESVAALAPEDIIRFHKQHYHLANMVVVVSGGVEHQALVEALDSVSMEAKEANTILDLKPQYPRARYQTDRLPSSMNLIFPAIDPGLDFGHGSVLSSLLTQVGYGLLFVKLRLEQRRVYSVSCSFAEYPFQYMVISTRVKSRFFDQIEQEVQDAIQTIVRTDISQDLWNCVIAARLVSLRKRDEYYNDISAGRRWVETLTDMWLEDDYQEYDAIKYTSELTIDQVAAVVKDTFSEGQLGVLTVSTDHDNSKEG
ncbi:M16 family metallopeptidase [Patescibacteria group bacterium]